MMIETADVIAETFEDRIHLFQLLGLTTELKANARMLGREEARYLVSTYYQVQEFRKAAANQVRSTEVAVPVLEWIAGNIATIERHIRILLGHYAEGAGAVGEWLMNIDGIGPVISAGLLAHIDITRASTASAVWRFAGLDPSSEWLGKERANSAVKSAIGRVSGPVTREDVLLVAEHVGRKPAVYFMHLEDAPWTAAKLIAAVAKRPWNADLKVLCWKAGESFVKVSGKEGAFYGAYYMQCKVAEEVRNEAGGNAKAAADKLAKYKIRKSTDAYKAYSRGELPPAHVHARAKRKVVKLFLAHLHGIMYEEHFGAVAPEAWVIAHGGHRDRIEAPNWPLRKGE